MGTTLTLHSKPSIRGSRPVNDISLLVTYMDELDALAAEAGVSRVSELGLVDSESEEIDDERLVSGAEGVKTFEALLEVLEGNPNANPENGQYGEILVEEVREVLDCLRKVAAKDARFCLLLV